MCLFIKQNLKLKQADTYFSLFFYKEIIFQMKKYTLILIYIYICEFKKVNF